MSRFARVGAATRESGHRAAATWKRRQRDNCDKAVVDVAAEASRGRTADHRTGAAACQEHTHPEFVGVEHNSDCQRQHELKARVADDMNAELIVAPIKWPKNPHGSTAPKPC